MRAPPPVDRKRSATVWVLIANVIAFLVECHFYGYPPRLHHHDYFALSSEGLRNGYVWQLLTFQFMHADLWHLLMNSWVIYQFGMEMEDQIGRGRFVALYFFSGTVGGLAQGIMGFILPYGQFSSPVIGASAGALGLLSAFATLRPRQSVFPLFPAVKALHLLFFFAVLAAVGMVFPTNNLANTAHLGGLVGGAVFVRFIVDGLWREFAISGKGHRPPAARSRPAAGGGSRELRSGPGVAEPPAEEDCVGGDFVSRAVDPILDKISAHGIQSLTDRERRTLEQARSRMARKP